MFFKEDMVPGTDKKIVSCLDGYYQTQATSITCTNHNEDFEFKGCSQCLQGDTIYANQKGVQSCKICNGPTKNDCI